jgi:cyanophycin synthetase
MLNIYTSLYAHAATRLRLPHDIIPPGIIEIRKGKKRIQFVGPSFGGHTVFDQKRAHYKNYTYHTLKGTNLPIIRQKIFTVDRLDDVYLYAKKQKFDVVLKPTNGMQGNGIAVRPKTKLAIKAACEQISTFGNRLIVEPYVAGDDYRFLVCKGKILAVAKRSQPVVVGDGKSTILSLIQKTNQSRTGVSYLTAIPITENTTRILATQKKKLESVLSVDEVVTVSPLANLNKGGSYTDIPVTDVHPDNAKAVLSVMKNMNLQLAGIDVLSTDITKSHRTNGARISEVNPNPGIKLHVYAENNPRPDIAEQIITRLLA